MAQSGREQSRLKVTDGLRGLAVTAVVLFHSVPSLAPGGFIGVDIFFVISGFVISLVYEQPLGSRSVTFGRFYVRRIKRLGPAYFGLVAATTVGALAVMRPHDLTNYGWSLLSQAVYMQNVAFWTIGDYFENALAKPLLHTWSLAVEEQFYLLFPFLVLAIRHRPRLRNWLLVALTLGSFLVGVAITATSPKTSFYWLPTRAWEFAVGFMVAAGYSKQPISGDMGTTFALAGALLILVSVFAFSSHSGMPSLQTILAVAGASAVLWSQNARGTAFLATGPAQFFGRISYSWYLWHWPPLAFYFLVTGAAATGGTVVLLGASGLALGYASYRIFEEPFHGAVWTSTKALLLLAAFCASDVACASYILERNGFVRRFAPRERALLAAQMDIPPYRCPILKRLQMWNRDVCRFTDVPGRPILLIGDSHADRFKELLQNYPLLITKQNCTALEFDERSDCSWTKLLRDVRALDVSRLVLISHWSRHYSAAEYQRLAMNLRAAQVPITLLLPTPEGAAFDPATYVKRSSFPEFVPLTAQAAAQQTNEFRSELLQIARLNPNLSLVDPLPTLCPGLCRFAAGGKPIYRDSNHLTLAGDRLLLPGLEDSFWSQPRRMRASTPTPASLREMTDREMARRSAR